MEPQKIGFFNSVLHMIGDDVLVN